MNIEQLRNYCLLKKGVTEHFPFDADTLVFKVLGKMFALFPLEDWEAGKGWVNLKADPDYTAELRAEYQSIQPGWHMSKVHWNSVYIHQGELPPQLILQLIDHSYDMVVKSLPKKLRDTL
ncbi:MmcQ/YjbR family DNA-binding protein [Geojedonia litorea]|uniref:MmcQ/YjbR family DNA-binding protein n=1 Tax=Geojedonia litorea TaxID=1268269 RepID=A0ABV9N9H5_9FLAO